MGFLRLNKTRLVIKKVEQSAGFLFLIIGFLYFLLNGNIVSAKDITISAYSTDRVLINGAVGIGNLNPRAKLDIVDTLNTSGGAASNTATPNGELIVGGTGTGLIGTMGIDAISGVPVNMWIQPRNSGSATFYNLLLNPLGGSVGIGTTTPAELFHVYSSGTTNARIEGNYAQLLLKVINDANYSSLGFLNTAGATRGYIKYDFSNDAMSFRTAGAEVARLTSTGQLGIGKTNPAASLDTTTNINANGTVNGTSLCIANDCKVSWAAAVGGANLWAGTTTGAIYNNNGANYVGIGTTNPTTKLDTYNTTNGAILRVGSAANGTANDASIDLYGLNGANTPTYARLGLSVYNNNAGSEAGNMTFSTVNGGTLAERMRIRYDGNVGIGTTNPGKLLDIYGTETNTTPFTNTISGIKITNAYTSAYNSGSDLVFGTGAAKTPIAGIMGIYNRNSGSVGGSLLFGSNAGAGAGIVERMRIDPDGNVGIGTTAPNANAKLDVSGAINITSNGSVADTELSGFTTFNPYFGLTIPYSKITTRVGSSYVNSALTFSTLTSSSLTEKMRITENGNVGIGTTNPKGLFHVYSIASSTDSLVAATNGYVGIAKTNPGANLDVVGGINASGSINGTSLCISGNCLVAWPTASISPWSRTSPYVYLSTSTDFVGIGVTNPITPLQVVSPSALTPALFQTTINNYGEINMQNLSAGNNASSDITATANNGTATSYYVNLGINSSAYNQATFNITGANDAYLFSSDSPLDIGTATTSAASVIKFFTGGTVLANERMRITPTGNVGIGNSNPLATLDVLKTLTGTDATQSNLQIGTFNYTGSPSGTGSAYVLNFAGYANGTTNIPQFNGVVSNIFAQNTGAGVITTQQAFVGATRVMSSGNTFNANGFAITPILTSTGSITNQYRGFAALQPSITGAGTIATAYGFYAQNQGQANVTNAYGLYIENQTGSPTNNYSIYSVGGTNYFGGNVGIGISNPSGTFQVANASSTSALFVNTAAGGGGNTGGFVGIFKTNPGTNLDIAGGLNANGTVNGTSLCIANDCKVSWAAAVGGANLWAGTTTGAIYNNNGANYVGIGVTNPSYPLHVYSANQTIANLTDAGTKGDLFLDDSGSSVGSGGTVTFGAAGQKFAAIKSLLQSSSGNGFGDLAFSVRNNFTDTALTEAMRIQKSGNVGIGTTAPSGRLGVQLASESAGISGMGTAWDSTYAVFGDAGNVNGAGVGIGYDIVNNAGVLVAGAPNVAWKNMKYYASTHNWYIAGSGQKMILDSSGNVGIGTTTPVSKLDIENSGYVALTINDSSSTQIPTINLQQGGVTKAAIEAGVGTSNRLDFSVNTYSRMMTLLNGNVGIGTTTPTNKLQVAGGIQTSGPYISPSGVTTVLSQETNYGQLQTFGSKPLYINPLGNNVIFSGANTNVGIGITNPSGTFQVANASSTSALFVNSASGNTGGYVGIFKTNPGSSLDTLLDMNANGVVNGTSLCIAGDCRVSWGSVFSAGGIVYKRTNVTSSPYTALATDYIIAYNGPNGGTITLATSTCISGRAYEITNETPANTVSVTTNNTPTSQISGQNSITLSPYNSIPVYCNGTSWFIY